MFEKKISKVVNKAIDEKIENLKDENPVLSAAVEHPVGALICAGAAFGTGMMAVKGAAAILTAPFRHNRRRRIPRPAPAPAPAPTPTPAPAPAAAPEQEPVLEPDGIM